MKITSAVFVKSYDDVKKCPEVPLPEYAFIGRSNVGKSSLINMLTGQKYLAKTSATPGKTTLINLFKINNNWLLADLPGYGFAKTSKQNQETFANLISEYLVLRKNLACTFILIDCRIPPQQIDMEFIEWMGENQLPFTIVFTKSDKLSKNELSKNIRLFEEKLMQQWDELPTMFVTSSARNTGKKEILDFIFHTNKDVSVMIRKK